MDLSQLSHVGVDVITVAPAGHLIIPCRTTDFDFGHYSEVAGQHCSISMLQPELLTMFMVSLSLDPVRWTCGDMDTLQATRGLFVLETL